MAETETVRSLARVAPWSAEGTVLDRRVERRLFCARRGMIVVVRLLPGDPPGAHAHALDQVTTVLGGRLEVRLGTDRRVLGPAESVRIPAGTPHASRALGKPAEAFHLYLPPEGTPPARPVRALTRPAAPR
jgi:quercetin dioxygenase-like cupin family protein